MTSAAERMIDSPGEILERLAVIERLLLRVLDQLRPLPPLTEPDPAVFGTLPPPPVPPSMRPASWPSPVVPPQPEWIAVLHRPKHRIIASEPELITEERQGCNKPALYLTRPFTTRERADITAMRVCFPGETQWRQPKPGDISLCSSCGSPINPWSDQDLDYDAVLLPEPSHRVRRRSKPPGSFPGQTAEVEAQTQAQLASLTDLAGELLSPEDRLAQSRYEASDAGA